MVLEKSRWEKSQIFIKLINITTDKVVYYSALKGVCKDIFPEGKEPKSQFRPEEPIDAMLSVESINARMVGSIINTGCINKILIELARKSREIMDLPQIDEFE